MQTFLASFLFSIGSHEVHARECDGNTLACFSRTLLSLMRALAEEAGVALVEEAGVEYIHPSTDR